MEKARSSPFSFLFPWLAPLVITFEIVDGGIAVQLSKNNRLLENWPTSKLRRVLPEALVKWIEEHQMLAGPQPYPLIRQFWQELTPLTSKKLVIEDSALAELEESSQPQKFGLFWVINRATQQIEGRFEGAERYLGMGWFQQGKSVWSLKNIPANVLDAHLKNLRLPINQAEMLLNSTIPTLHKLLPTRADFRLITDFTLQVKVADVRMGTLTLGLECNYPQLLFSIQMPQQAGDFLLSDWAIIQFPRQAVTPVLAQLLQNRSSLTIHGADVPYFIQEQLPIMRRHRQISDEMAEKITQSYPIISIATLKPTLSLSHKLEGSIGKYSMTASYRYQQHTLDMPLLLAAHKKKQRFVQQHGVWFDCSVDQHTIRLIEQQMTTQAVRTEELMGLDTRRIDSLHAQQMLPKIQPVGATYLERSQSLFRQLQYHGIPGGIVSGSVGITSMFTAVWQELLMSNRHAEILWLVPSNRKGMVTRAVNNSAFKNRITVASLVTLRDTPTLFSRPWTLVLFHRLDLLLDGSAQSRRLFQLKWQWALITVTSKYGSGPSIMQVLHLPEQYHRQFCERYLFDLERSYPTVVASTSAPSVNTAQAPLTPKKEERSAVVSTPPPATQPAQRTTEARQGFQAAIQQRIEEQKALAQQHFEAAKAEALAQQLLAAEKAPTASKTFSFWEQARVWKDRSHSPVPLESFEHVFPTYLDMNAQQLEWYFYWRNEVRNGRYPVTDIGYILVHVYETLACIGFADPELARKRLIALWKHYRDLFPILDKYLIPWIADFCAVYQMPSLIMQWYTLLLTIPNCAIDVQLIAEAWLRQGGDWAKMPSAVFYALIGWNNKASTNQGPRHTLDEIYHQALTSVSQYLRSKQGVSGLVAYYGKDGYSTVKRFPFAQALVEKSYPEITIASVNKVFSNREFRNALCDILKYADYISQKLQQKPVASFAPAINVDWQRAIEEALGYKPAPTDAPAKPTPIPSQPPTPTQPNTKASVKLTTHLTARPTPTPPQPPTPAPVRPAAVNVTPKPAPSPARRKIELDQRKIAAVQEDTEILQDRLTVEEEEEQISPVMPIEATSTPSQPRRDEESSRKAPEHLQASPRIPAKTAEVVRESAKSTLAAPQQPAKLLVEKKAAEPMKSTPAPQAAVSLNMEAISQLQEEPADLQERLILENEEPEQLASDTQSEPVPAPPRSSRASEAGPEVDEDWQLIYPQWKAEHWAIITALQQGQANQLAALAQKAQRPLSTLIDEINAPVTEQLGDLLIEPETHTIYSDLLDIAGSLVNWYISSQR